MKTIQERAADYAGKAWSNIEDFNEDHVTFENIVTDAFVAGAQSEREELLRWRDPNVELPKDGEEVLIKTTMCKKYCVAFYKGNNCKNYRWHENNGAIDDDMVVGWRPIREE